MKYNFADIKEKSPLTLMLHSGNMHMRMDAVLVSHMKENIAVITLETNVKGVLKFEGIKIEVTYVTDNGIPYKWNNAKIVYYKNSYVIQVIGEGHRFNRRNTYRVSIGKLCQMRTPDGKKAHTMLHDISLSGFSITDKNNDYKFKMGDNATITYEDLGYNLDLFGKVVRIDVRAGYILYGFSIIRSCRDLPTYISTKQRRKRQGLPPSYVLPPTNK